MAKKRVQKDKNAPKRPLNSFVLFGNDLRKNDDEIKKLSIKEQTTAISEKWKSVDEGTKKKYVEEAARLKDEYLAKSAEYKAMQKENNVAEGQFESPKKKARKPGKISGYQLFINENKELTEEDKNDPELSGKNRLACYAVKWGRLSEEQRSQYNEKAAKLVPHNVSVSERKE